MRKIDLPLGKQKEIIAMYNDKSIKVSEILETYQISRPVLNRILTEQKVPFRLEKAKGPRTNLKIKKCHICHKFVGVADAAFCPYCGADVRSKSEKLIYRISDLWNYMYPKFTDSVEQEEVKKIIDEIIQYLKNN